MYRCIVVCTMEQIGDHTPPFWNDVTEAGLSAEPKTQPHEPHVRASSQWAHLAHQVTVIKLEPRQATIRLWCLLVLLYTYNQTREVIS